MGVINFGNIRIDWMRWWKRSDAEPHRIVDVRVFAGEAQKVATHINIYVSPTGRSVRIFRNGRELK